jgi:hypothetical protein
MFSGFVGSVFPPAFPDDAGPGAGQDADRVGVIAAALERPPVHIGCPDRALSRVVGKTRQGLAQFVIAGPPEGHRTMLSRRVGNRRNAGERSEVFGGLKSFAIATKLRGNHRRGDTAASGKALQDIRIGKLAQSRFDLGGEGAYLGDEWLEGGNVREDCHGCSFGNIARESRTRSTVESQQQVCGGTPSAVSVFAQEALKLLFGQFAVRGPHLETLARMRGRSAR